MTDSGSDQIEQYNLEFELQKVFEHADLTRPKSVHPLSDNIFIIATKTGLLKLFTVSETCSVISQGYFFDVHIAEYIAVLEVNTGGNQIVHLYNKTHDHQLYRKITLENQFNRSIYIHDHHLYVSVSNVLFRTSFKEGIDNITKYTLDGTKMCEISIHGNQPGDLNVPRITTADSNHCLLVADGGNNRLQVFDEWLNSWTVVNLPGFTCDKGPYDVFFISDTVMAVLFRDVKIEMDALKFYTIRK
jgi:hypothetical protein